MTKILAATLQCCEFSLTQFPNLKKLASRLTALKQLASRHRDTVLPVTIPELYQLNDCRRSQHLLLQYHTALVAQNIVGMLAIVRLPLSEGAYLGPLVVDTASQPRGHGTKLLQFGLQVLRDCHPQLRHITLTTHPSRSLTDWYAKHGFVPYDTNVFRLHFT